MAPIFSMRLAALSLGLVILMVVDAAPQQCKSSTLLTFNTGQIPLVASYDERKKIIPDALAETDADVLCLQEVYFEDDIAAILKATKRKYPYSYSEIHSEVGRLRDRQTGVLAKCGNILSRRARFNPLGLLLLSKTPFSATSPTYYFGKDTTMVFPTGYIDASVENVGKVVCTHLTANLGPYFEIGLNYGSWEKQQKAEINMLTSTFSSLPHILLGDLNTGPHDPARNLTGNFPANYAALQAAGYKNPYDESGGHCTFCGLTNPVAKGTFPYEILIDHVMSFNLTHASAERVLETHDGETLSDHYGVQVQACF